MSKILFEDTYRKETASVEVEYFFKGNLTFASVIALIAALVFAFLGEFLICIALAIVSAIGFVVVKLRGKISVKKAEKAQAAGLDRSYMRVYDDKVIVKKPCQKEKVYNVTPNQYTITLNHGGGRVCARLVYLFADKHGNRIFKYASNTSARNYKVLKSLMVYDVRDVGCRNIFDVVGLLENDGGAK